MTCTGHTVRNIAMTSVLHCPIQRNDGAEFLKNRLLFRNIYASTNII